MPTQLDASLRLRLIDEVSQTAQQIASRFGAVGSSAEASAKGASAAYEELRLKELGAQQESQRLAAALRELQRAGNASEAEIRDTSLALVRSRDDAVRFGSAARDLSRELDRLERESAQAAAAERGLANAEAQAAQAASASSQTTKTGFFAVTDASKAKGRALAENVNLVSELALGFGGLSPTTQQLGLSFASAGNNAFALASSMGPIGVVVGTLVGVLPGLIHFLRETSSAQDETADAAARTNRTFAEQIDLVRRMRGEQEQEEAALRGLLDVEEQQDRLQAARNVVQQKRSAEQSALDRELRRTTSGQVRSDEEVFRQAVGELRSRGINERNATAIVNEIGGARFTASASPAQAIAQVLGAAERVREAGNRAATGEGEAGISIGQAEQRVRQLEGGLREAQARQAIEDRREQVNQAQEAATGARARLTDTLSLLRTSDGRALSSQQQAAIVARIRPGGRLSAEQQRLLGGRAGDVEGLIQGAIAAEDTAARVRLSQGEGQGFDAEAEPVAERVVRRVARREARPRAAPAAPSVDLAAFAAEIDRVREGGAPGGRRTQLVVRIEDHRRATATLSSEGGRPDIDVDASSADVLGGQQ